jgi:hypothetical protein
MGPLTTDGRANKISPPAKTHLRHFEFTLEAISNPFFAGLRLLESAKLAALNLENSGLRPSNSSRFCAPLR